MWCADGGGGGGGIGVVVVAAATIAAGCVVALNGVSTYSLAARSFSGLGAPSVTCDEGEGAAVEIVVVAVDVGGCGGGGGGGGFGRSGAKGAVRGTGTLMMGARGR